MSRTRLCARAAAALAASALAFAAVPMDGAPARAQEEAAAASLQVVSLPVWRSPDDPFAIRVRITNEGSVPLEDYSLVVGVLNRVETRSALHAAYDLSPLEATNSFPVLPGPERPIAPGDSVTARVDDPVGSLILLGPGAANGVYPLKLTLQDAFGATLATATTQLLFYAEPQDVRLTIVPVVPIHDIPARAPDGTFPPDEDGVYPLEEAVEEGGWLATMLEVLEAEVARSEVLRQVRPARRSPPPPPRLGIAPSARLVEELADMADGYRRVEDGEVVPVPAASPEARAARDALEGLTALLAADGVQTILAPYAFPDLPTIATTEGAVTQQMNEAALVLHDFLGREVDPRWVFAPGGRLDAGVLAELPPGAAGLRTFFSPDSLEEPEDPAASGCPVAVLSLACPLTVEVPTGGAVTGYAHDPDLQRHLVDLAAGDDPRVALQRFFAETAMIREESPGLPRVVVATTSTAWRPRARELRAFLRGLARAPWLASATPVEGIGATEARAARMLVPVAPQLADRPSTTYFAEVDEAGDAVEHFVSVEPPAVLAERLRRNVLVALSRAWWDDRQLQGFAYARAARDEVEEELSKIGVLGAAETTLTSSEGALQFVVFNDTGYEVTVRVYLEARGDLEVEDAARELEIASDQQTVSYDVTARASGIFPITVSLETPDGLEIEEPQTFTVRSTEFNQIALGLTFGALAFLVLFYLVRLLSRRRRDGTPAAEADDA